VPEFEPRSVQPVASPAHGQSSPWPVITNEEDLELNGGAEGGEVTCRFRLKNVSRHAVLLSYKLFCWRYESALR
jgi:hypothetical protein